MSDLISRKNIIEKLRKHKTLFCKNRIEYSALSKDEKARVDEIDNCIAELLNAPSAEPERKKGKWILLDGYRCSVCNHKLQSTGIPTFCPYCGADMRGDR